MLLRHALLTNPSNNHETNTFLKYHRHVLTLHVYLIKYHSDIYHQIPPTRNPHVVSIRHCIECKMPTFWGETVSSESSHFEHARSGCFLSNGDVREWTMIPELGWSGLRVLLTATGYIKHCGGRKQENTKRTCNPCSARTT